MSNDKRPAIMQKRDQLDTIIGPGTKFEGEITAIGMIRIDGVYKGNLTTQGDVLIGDQGEVNGSLTTEGDITVVDNGVVAGHLRANNVIIAGRAQAEIKSGNLLEIKSTGKVLGDVDVAKLVIENGAIFRGQCVMQEKEPFDDKPKIRIENTDGNIKDLDPDKKKF